MNCYKHSFNLKIKSNEGYECGRDLEVPLEGRGFIFYRNLKGLIPPQPLLDLVLASGTAKKRLDRQILTDTELDRLKW